MFATSFADLDQIRLKQVEYRLKKSTISDPNMVKYK